MSSQDNNVVSVDNLAKIYTASGAGLCISEYKTCKIIFCNTIYGELFDTLPDELIGSINQKLFENTNIIERFFQKKTEKDTTSVDFFSEDIFFPEKGRMIRFTHRLAAWHEESSVIVTSFLDVTELKKMEDDLNKAAYQDRSFQVANSLCLEIDFKEEYYTFLIALNVVGLKKINEIYGREFGDELLRKVRDFIISLNIPHSKLYRADIGDYLIFLKNIYSLQTVMKYARKILRRFSNSWHIEGNDAIHEVISSLSTCVIPINETNNTSLNFLYSIAEQTLMMSSSSNTIAVYDDEVHRHIHQRIALELKIKQAIKNNMEGFSIHYQPVVEPGIAMWSNIEALCRWTDPEFGIIDPEVFIPIAETVGLIKRIDLWVTENAIKQIIEWKLHEIERFILEINISPLHLAMPNFFNTIINLINKYNYPPSKLCLEITESNELIFSKDIRLSLKKLKERGVKLAIDDFGLGHSSLSSIARMPIEILKIDKSFIAEITSNKQTLLLVNAMIELAHHLEMKVVAKGVETEHQARTLLKLGIDYMQGNHYSIAVPPYFLAPHLVNFHAAAADLIALGFSEFEIARIASNKTQGFPLTPKLNKTLNQCLQELLSNSAGFQAIDIALRYIGKAINVSRAYLFLRDQGDFYSNTHEWCAQGIEPVKDSLQNIDMSNFAFWTNTLKRDKYLVAADVNTLDKSCFEFLSEQGIKAVVEFPIFKNNVLEGWVGFDDCNSIHNWTREEIQMLHTLTQIIASTLAKHWLQEEITEEAKRRETILNRMDTLIFVSDITTNEILFANEALKKTYGVDDVVGQKCYEALHCETKVCEFCPIKKLDDNPNNIYRWEFYNKRLKKHYRVFDSLINWSGGKLVHLEYAVDVTELKESQEQLRIYASLDNQTGTLTRAAFIENATVAKEMHESLHFPFTIVFIDIDELKLENDTYGHHAGDTLISHVVEAIKENITELDIFGRWGGDEFVIAFHNTVYLQAEEIIKASLRQVIKFRERESAVSFGFSYGIVEYNAEQEMSLSQLVNLADEKMFNYKQSKAKHQ